MALTRKVRFRKFSMKSLRNTLEGAEQPYPVYFFGAQIRFEIPERPDTLYRNIRRNPLPELPESSIELGFQDYLEADDPDYVATE